MPRRYPSGCRRGFLLPPGTELLVVSAEEGSARGHPQSTYSSEVRRVRCAALWLHIPTVIVHEGRRLVETSRTWRPGMALFDVRSGSTALGGEDCDGEREHLPEVSHLGLTGE